MSNGSIENISSFQHRKQPIHFYPPSKLQDTHNPSNNKNNVFSASGYLSPKSMSPNKQKFPASNVRSPQLTLKAQNVSPSQKNQSSSSYQSKYSKFSSKIDMLQKNLNRLYGQHQSMKQMFQNSQNLAKSCQIFQEIDKLRLKIQEAKVNKFIEQKRHEARYEVAFEEYFDKFAQLQTQLFINQGQGIYRLEKSVKKRSSQRQNLIKNKYGELFQSFEQSLVSTKRNYTKYLDQIEQNIKKQSQRLIQTLEVEEEISKRQIKVHKKIEVLKTKMGELKCITQYQMFLLKECQINQELSDVKKSKSQTTKGESNEQAKTRQMQQIQLKFIKDERNFVGLQSIDRLATQLANEDLKFVQIIEKYKAFKQTQKKQKKNTKMQSANNNKNDVIHKDELFDKELQLTQANFIDQKIFNINYQVQGLKKYLSKSLTKIHKIQQQKNQIHELGYKNQQHQTPYEESIKDLQQKIDKLDSNLQFFKTKIKGD